MSANQPPPLGEPDLQLECSLCGNIFHSDAEFSAHLNPNYEHLVNGYRSEDSAGSTSEENSGPTEVKNTPVSTSPNDSETDGENVSTETIDSGVATQPPPNEREFVTRNRGRFVMASEPLRYRRRAHPYYALTTPPTVAVPLPVHRGNEYSAGRNGPYYSDFPTERQLEDFPNIPVIEGVLPPVSAPQQIRRRPQDLQLQNTMPRNIAPVDEGIAHQQTAPRRTQAEYDAARVHVGIHLAMRELEEIERIQEQIRARNRRIYALLQDLSNSMRKYLPDDYEGPR